MQERLASAGISLLRIILTLFYSLDFGGIGKGSRLGFFMKVRGRKNITIGRRCNIESFSWLEATRLCEGSSLVIKDNVQIGRFAHIYSGGDLEICSYVLIADNVYISNVSHNIGHLGKEYIVNNGIEVAPKMSVGRGTWIGEGAKIFGCSIGSNCVVGANSVVITDVPDNCMAVGSPARIIKRYNKMNGLWEKQS